MTRKTFLSVMIAILSISLLSGCSKKKKVPESMAPVPADADVVATLDAKAIIDYAKKTLPKFIPAEMKDEIPNIEMLAQQLMQMAGIDLSKLGQITFIGYAGSEDKMAFIAEGVSTKGLKGEKKGEHNGVTLYSMPDAINYAELSGRGMIGAPSMEMLKKVIDTNAGKSKRLADSDRAALFSELAGIETGLNQVRFYLLTGDFPEMGPSPVTLKGGGFFIHLDKGLSLTIVSDKDGADELKRQLDIGMMGVQMALAMPEGGDMGLPVKLDAETKKLITDFLGKIKTDKSGSTISISYSGDLKPIIEKAIAMGVDQFKGAGTKIEIPVAEKAIPVDVPVKLPDEALKALERKQPATQ
ncbi:MAG: hypothetical protein JRJ87_05870 [Deltaproteobacteria bacterium]|nr:hypothetical protein [Deltaproteobacteria bacterium]